MIFLVKKNRHIKGDFTRSKKKKATFSTLSSVWFSVEKVSVAFERKVISKMVKQRGLRVMMSTYIL